LDEIVEFEQHISEMTHITNVLRFRVNMWYQTRCRIPRKFQNYDELFCKFL